VRAQKICISVASLWIKILDGKFDVFNQLDHPEKEKSQLIDVFIERTDTVDR
jgi:hypothetical protein